MLPVDTWCLLATIIPSTVGQRPLFPLSKKCAKRKKKTFFRCSAGAIKKNLAFRASLPWSKNPDNEESPGSKSSTTIHFLCRPAAPTEVNLQAEPWGPPRVFWKTSPGRRFRGWGRSGAPFFPFCALHEFLAKALFDKIIFNSDPHSDTVGQRPLFPLSERMRKAGKLSFFVAAAAA